VLTPAAVPFCPHPPGRHCGRHDAHFWVGKNSSQDEYSTAAYFTINLDLYLKGDIVQHREIQNYESQQFLSYFKTITFHETSVDAQFNKVAPKDYKLRLLHLKGTRTVVAREVPVKIESLNSGDVFILDNGLDIYTFKGREAGGMERAKSDEIGRAIVKERGGAPKLFVFNEDEENEAADKFWSFFGGRKPIAPATPDSPPASTRRMFRLSDETGRMLFREVTPYGQDKLDTNDAFIIDAGDAIFIWVGKNASEEERKQGLAYATDYMFKNNKPKWLPVARFKEGGETDYFWSAF